MIVTTLRIKDEDGADPLATRPFEELVGPVASA
jgi:hypothetical protein